MATSASRTLFSRALHTATRTTTFPKQTLRRNLTTLNTSAARSTTQQPLRRAAQRNARFQSTEAAPKKGGNGTLLALLAVAIAGGAGYAYTTGALDAYLGVDPEEAKKQKTGKGWIPSFKDYQDVYNDIAAILEDDSDYDDGSYAPVLVRLGWHASGTYDKETKTGGSNGATMRFEPEGGHGANAGLKVARDLMEKIKEKHPWITYSDLWTLAAVVAIQEMGGPVIPWRPGRTDKDVTACTPDGRLPDASKDQKHVRDIFYRMGFDDREIVALLGAHAIGRCHPDRSGYEGPWTFSPTYFTNEFYKLLLNEKWIYKKWKGPSQFIDKKTGGLMMLPTDMVLVKDKEFRKHVERYAADEKVFFDEFRDAFGKLLELGVPFEKDEKWTFKRTTDDA